MLRFKISISERMFMPHILKNEYSYKPQKGEESDFIMKSTETKVLAAS